MSLTKLLNSVRQKPAIEVRQHRYAAPLRPKQKKKDVVRWARRPLSRPTDFDEVTGKEHPSSADIQETLKSYKL